MSEATEQNLREEVNAWLSENWDPNLPLKEWRTRLLDSGWGVPGWSKQWYGRDMSTHLTQAVQQEIADFGAIGVAQIGVATLATATLLEHGSDEQKKKYLRQILIGEGSWCQLFSEPGSGSDLAGSTTRADRDGDHWVINGQKVWTTSAHHATHGLLLARTDWDVPKHQGLSYFIIEFDQPGVEVKPLKQMNGSATFNEVFLTDAIVSADNLVGKLNQGWQVAVTTLAHERRGADGVRVASTRKGEGSIFRELQVEIDTVMEPYKWYPQRQGRPDLMIERAKETGAYADSSVRQEIAKTLMQQKAGQWTARRARAAQILGRPQGPEGSLGKLGLSNIARAAARVHTQISGASIMLKGEDDPLKGILAAVTLSVPAISIAGGTDEIQKNIISERVLGLPKEPRTDTDGPFRDVPRNQPTK